MTSYPTLSLSAARNLMKLFEINQSTINISDFISIKGTGDSIEDLLNTLEKVIAKESKDLQEGRLDAKLSPIVHRYLSGSEPQLLQDRDFWRYLSCFKFHNLVAMRFPVTKKSKETSESEISSNWENYGAKVEDVKNSYIYRLFLASELTHDSEAKNPYHLVEAVTDVDIYRSHIIRVKSGDNPDYCRALLSWWAERESWYKRHEKKLNISALRLKYDKLDRRHLRDIAKRTLRLRSNIVHEFLTRNEVEELIENEAIKSIRGIANWGVLKNSVKTKSLRKVKSRGKKSRKRK